VNNRFSKARGEGESKMENPQEILEQITNKFCIEKGLTFNEESIENLGDKGEHIELIFLSGLSYCFGIEFIRTNSGEIFPFSNQFFPIESKEMVKEYLKRIDEPFTKIDYNA